MNTGDKYKDGKDEEVKLPPILSSVDKQQNPYKVPDAYFSSMEDQIRDKITAREKGIFKRFINLLKKPVVSVPVSLALAALAMLLIFKKPSDKRLQDMQGFSHEELVNSDIFFDLDEDLLMESFFSTNNSQANLSSDDAQFFNEAEQYLIDHKMDVNLIMKEL